MGFILDTDLYIAADHESAQAEALAEFAPGSFRRSLVHDAMLAASCRQFGHTLVTANLRDFELIGKVERFAFVPPFPD